MPYQDSFQFLVDLGLLDVVLPFILVFIIVYGVLQKTEVLGTEKGKPKKKINAMIAFVLGFFAVLATNLLNVINGILFYFVLLLVIALLLALVLGLVGAEGGTQNNIFIAIMIVLTALFTFYGLARAGIIDENRFFSTLLWPVLALAALGTVLYFALREKKKPARTSTPERQPPRQQQPEEGMTQEELAEALQIVRRRRAGNP